MWRWKPPRWRHKAFVSWSPTAGRAQPERQSRLFRRFEQAGRAHRVAYGGSGLRLAISQELAAAMGPHRLVESAPGRAAVSSSSFRLRMPAPRCRSRQHNNVARGRDGGITPAWSGRSDRRRGDAGPAARTGHAVVHAAPRIGGAVGGRHATLRRGLLDLDLPGLDGIALARMLRAQGVAVPLLAVTARSDAEAEIHARAASSTTSCANRSAAGRFRRQLAATCGAIAAGDVAAAIAQPRVQCCMSSRKPTAMHPGDRRWDKPRFIGMLPWQIARARPCPRRVTGRSSAR